MKKREGKVILLVLIVLMVSSVLTACAGYREVTEEQSQQYQEALDYTSNYNDNVVGDPSFTTSLSQSLTTIREYVVGYATPLALLPPIVAIVLALITKEVYISLFAGILTGAGIFAIRSAEGFLSGTFTEVYTVITAKLGDKWNIGIIVFLVVLGIMVSLMNKAGGSAAYGEWASKKTKTRTGAMLSTMVLGVLIFVDDYFNCLTVGNVMRPVTDKQKVSRAKLAYLIDATAAPVCIIAPISSWAAAVTSVAPEGEGLKLFIRSIPYNLYALLTLLMIVLISVMKFDYGPMKKHEMNAMNGDLFTSGGEEFGKEDIKVNTRAKVIDLILPVVMLIALCIFGMVYTGGLFDAGSGANFITAFSDCDASKGLVLGSFIALAFTMIYYAFRRVLSFKQMASSITEGFKAMVPAILILTFAWTLSGITLDLGAKIFVAEFVRNSAAGFTAFLPAIVFLIALGLAFATGTSWGTFGILLPIVCSVFASGDEMMVITIAACLAGAVCGDHCSPISDTTIMASAGAQSNHINHVSTQLPYALTVAAISCIGYILAGFVHSAWIVLPVSAVILVVTLFVIRMITTKDKVANK